MTASEITAPVAATAVTAAEDVVVFSTSKGTIMILLTLPPMALGVVLVLVETGDFNLAS
jgi:hypothetical protein